MDPIKKRIYERRGGILSVSEAKQAGLHLYNQPIEEFDGEWVIFKGQRMLNLASYSYLNLLKHPKIEAAAQQAMRRYGTGTHGVRILSGTLPLHEQLEQTIANFYGAEESVVFPSGYTANLAAIPALVGRGDIVICDRYDHASIVDGCMLSQARLMRFRHNDMTSLESQLQRADTNVGRLVITDAVFSMDGDIINLPEVSRLCRKYGAYLMVDEAHSLGVLGETGHGIEEYFGLKDAIDIKMGTLSKTIPSMGGYIAGNRDLVSYLKHVARPFVFSGALSPALTAAAQMSFEIIREEPERVKKLQHNSANFLKGIKSLSFDTLNTQTPIVPIICGQDETAYRMARLCHESGVYVLPVVSPAVPNDLARLRVTVTSAHSEDDVVYALEVLERAGRSIGLI